MKKRIKAIQAWLRVLIYFIILALATRAAGTIPFLNDFWFFVLIAASISQIFLWADGKSILSLNFLPNTRAHWRQLFVGIAGGIIMLLITATVTISLTGDQWHINRIDLVFVSIIFLSCLWSAFAQEFVFRGFPFQILAQTYSSWIAQLAVAVPFGLMHISHNMKASDIALIMLTTGLGSVLFGLAYLRTRHLALSIGLHQGWNFAQALIPRTAGSKGPTLITVTGDPAHYTWPQVLLPFIVVILISIILFYVLPGEVRNHPRPVNA